MPLPLLKEWRDQGNVRAIVQIELLQILLAKQIWRNRTRQDVLLYVMRNLLIFTDGAEEEGENAAVACGALLIDPIDGIREYFGESVPLPLLKEWKDQGK